MRKELDELLCKNYPRIFRGRHRPVTETAMCWGFDCGDGWYRIIDTLCSDIERYVRNRRQDRLERILMNRALSKAIKGDTSSLNRLPAGPRQSVLRNLGDPEPQCFQVPRKLDVVATQVKEKYGTLRFYIYGGDSYINGLIDMAESMSAITCEVCGAPGEIRDGGWVRTLCDVHAKEEGYYE